MGTTSFSTSNASTVKLWSDRVWYDIASDKELPGKLAKMGVLQQKEDTTRSAGDTINYQFLRRLSNRGFIGNTTVTGLEQAMTYDNDQLKVDQLRNVVQIPNIGTIDAQRVKFDLPEDSYTVLRNWMIEHETVGILNQLAGNTATSITWDGVSYTGDDRLSVTAMNAAVAPSTDQIIRANGLATDALVNADTTATMKFTYIDQCVDLAQKLRPYIRKLEQKGGINYICIVHLDQWVQLIQDTTAPIQYRDIMLSKITGGSLDESLIGSAMEYNQTLIIATDKIPYGVSSSTAQTNTRRAVFAGMEAGCIAFGKGYTLGTETTPGFSFQQDFQDVEQWKRIAIRGVWGAKKSTFNNIDRGTIVITTYVA